MTDLDLYAEENEPCVKFSHTTYLVRLPHPASMHYLTKQLPFIYVEVDEYGLAHISNRSVWGGAPVSAIDSHSRDHWALTREIIDYLVEWELLEWKRIGPEDSEVFATDKLLNGVKQDV